MGGDLAPADVADLLAAEPAPLADAAGELAVDDATRRALEGLGYLEDPGSEGGQD